MTSQECRHCGRLIADLESAPRDSMGAYCTDCEIEDVVKNVLADAYANDDGDLRAAAVLCLLASEGFAVTKVKP